MRLRDCNTIFGVDRSVLEAVEKKFIKPSDLKKAAKFYREHVNCEVFERDISASGAQLDDAMCELGGPPGDDSSIEEFKKVALSLCKGDPRLALSVAVQLARFEVSGVGNMRYRLIYIKDEPYFIDFVEVTS